MHWPASGFPPDRLTVPAPPSAALRAGAATRHSKRHLSRAIRNPRTTWLDRRKLVGQAGETEEGPPARPILRRQPRSPARSRRAPGRQPSGQPRRMPCSINNDCRAPHAMRLASSAVRTLFASRLVDRTPPSVCLGTKDFLKTHPGRHCLFCHAGPGSGASGRAGQGQGVAGFRRRSTSAIRCSSRDSAFGLRRRYWSKSRRASASRPSRRCINPRLESVVKSRGFRRKCISQFA